MIRPITLQEAAGVLGAVAPADDPVFTNVSTDTRAVRPGDLFVALRGERFDGHRFLQAAKTAGAVAAVVEEENPDIDLPQLRVADTVQALADLARHNRELSDAAVVALTGSSGKTTLKEMLSAILAGEGETLATSGNLNNHIGAPLTLFRLSPQHRFAVIELGASGMGEIAHTVAVARPHVAVITNAGEAHLEGFGGYDNIVQGKGEIIDGVAEGGVVVLNRDDPAFDRWLQRAGSRRVISASAKGLTADYRCSDYEPLDGGYRFTVEGPGGQVRRLMLAMPGIHNIGNALLAIAAAEAISAGERAIEQGLAAVRPTAGRLQRQELSEQITLIDDSYNANPSSVKAALAVLAEAAGTRIAVLGAMAELGGEAPRLHREVGEKALALGIDHCLVVGTNEDCRALAEGAGESALRFDNHGQAVDWLLSQHTGPVTVLVKGSRSSAMDQVVTLLKEKVNNPCSSG
ncbi:UDP-N-acetylmuramoyl-tripeptide--D-alanyl-D-alanine ligase [Marinobacter daqiaonensis]|uniref:UDP-N-acetylmuramoyl-tripeptide--D-alanyl-D-alanine ligase n=1 Tax=Marinobacter daqiaonensis TaxID=650891 RepID=A0A1I6J2T1_9GAMM|nr:UDP-N-acetylmuramoyl-tripeptide--D-alanyl-D-alanine ligase [Marinobacter daqiaonensis]SFR73324.1 UDP-N-acetylmuramoyl-tripeptide--D-alanyl-D-alanine ligase [Marinobacter daqiaonensis]